MKKRNVFITLGLTLAIGIGIGATLSFGNEIIESKAANDISSVTLKGSFDEWGDGISFVKQSNGDYTLSHAFVANQEFKIFVTGAEDKWVGADWGISSSQIDSEFVGGTGNFKALTSYTLNLTVKSTFYTNWGSDVFIKLGETRTVQFVDSSGNIYDGTENLVEESNQFTGLITTTTAGAKFRIKDTIGSVDNYYNALENGVTLATVSGDYISITTSGTYMIYFKKASHESWVSEAGETQQAYFYANYFLAKVGCDPEGLEIPSGWSNCASRYAILSDDAKDFIYNFDVSKAESGDDVAEMIERYEWAINHNPNSLSHFITNRSGTARAISASRVINPAIEVKTNNYIIAVVVISSISLISLGGFFFLRKRKEDR